MPLKSPEPVRRFGRSSARDARDARVLQDVVLPGLVDPHALFGLNGASEKGSASLERNDLIVDTMNHQDRSRPYVANQIRWRKMGRVRAGLCAAIGGQNRSTTQRSGAMNRSSATELNSAGALSYVP